MTALLRGSSALYASIESVSVSVHMCSSKSEHKPSSKTTRNCHMLLHRLACEQMLCVYSPGGSTFLREMTSWPPSGKCDVKSKI